MRPVVVDTETTGLEPSEGAELVEVAAIMRNEREQRVEFSELCRPRGPIPPESKAVHHITEAMVADADEAGEVVSRMRITMCDDLGDVVWVAHNAAFDQKFLPDLPGPWICTYRCAMHIWPDAPGHSNQVLRYWRDLDGRGDLRIPENLAPHRALYDIIVTEGILDDLALEIQQQQDCTYPEALQHLVELSSKPIVLKICRFKKHRGENWADVPSSYLSWFLQQKDVDPDVRHTCVTILRERGMRL